MSNNTLAIFESRNASKELLAENVKNGFMSLEPKRKLFAYEYLLDYNHMRAAEEVGFSKHRGIGLLREPLLGEFIEFLKKEQSMRLNIDSDMIKTMWLETILILSGKTEAPRLMKDGGIINVKAFEAAPLVSALREMGKSTKFYEDGSGDDKAVTITIDMGSLGVKHETAAKVVIEDAEFSEDLGDSDGAPL